MPPTTLFYYKILCCMACLLAMDAHAGEYSFSGFGTLGGAISDDAITYQRSIDKNGTLMRDSLLGVQVDARFNEQWGATMQVVLAPRTDDDNGFEPQLKWTLLSYRPSNDWLIRLGRMSLGGLLNQQNMDVGVSYDMARLPNEVYLRSSTYDFDGLSIAKSWYTADYEITLDGSFGMQNQDVRVYNNGSETPMYYSADIIGGGFVLTVSDYEQTMIRLGWQKNDIDPDTPAGFLCKFTFRELGGGLYTLGPPEYTSQVKVNSFFLGARFPLGAFLLAGEGTLIVAEDVDPAPATVAAYVSVSRKLDRWTPYLTHARIWTDGMDTWRKVRGATAVPQFGITQAMIDDLSSSMRIYDQSSWMLGTSYAFTPKQKLKAEVMLTHVGERSAMFDGDIAHDEVMVYSLSYNFSF